MKVFCCKNQWSYGGGLILIAANTKEEAYLIAAYDDKTSYLFDLADDDYIWCEPDGNGFMYDNRVDKMSPTNMWAYLSDLLPEIKHPEIPECHASSSVKELFNDRF